MSLHVVEGKDLKSASKCAKKKGKIESSALFDKLKWMTAFEAATYLRVSVGQVRNMVWRGQLPAYKLNNRLRFLRSDLDRSLRPLHGKEALWR
ncbi:MAG: helix-turn-helix domain-containing protein [Bdellovibrionales bacterium]|nr:helix-turn-helix domain-containing protein [Bdellovibrionales bacterium]